VGSASAAGGSVSAVDGASGSAVEPS
jgi:hypothetical protein